MSAPAERLDGSHGSRIGPNAITQTVAALRARHGDAAAVRVLRKSLGCTLDALPSAMVDERQANALMAGVRDDLGESRAAAVHREAGVRTADYLLAHRIPRPAQLVIRVLPSTLGLRLLLRAVAAHAWTFAGSGRFFYHVGRATTLRFVDCAICRDRPTDRPACAFYAATFERLLRTLIDDRIRVTEVECAATGGRECRFVAKRA